MFSDYFGAVGHGRLASVPFLIRWLVLVAIFFAVLVGIGLMAGVIDRVAGGDVAAVREHLMSTLGGPVAIGLLLFIFVVAFAFLNILAKRARDVGLPGWLTAIVIAGLSGGVSQVGHHMTSGGVGLILVLILAFLPTDMMRSK